jgi:hypothetical protein
MHARAHIHDAVGRRRRSGSKSRVAMLLVVQHRSGPRWDPSRAARGAADWPAHAAFMDGLLDDGFVVLGGPLAEEHRVALAIEADSEDAVHAALARDPWTGTHLETASVDPWTIRFDGRRGAADRGSPSYTAGSRATPAR